MVILQLIHVSVTDFQEGLLLPVTKPTQTSSGLWVSLGNNSNLEASACGASYKCLTYQLSTVGYLPTVALTGNGELGFDSGEGACETATTSKEGSRRANYPFPTRGGSDEK